MRRRIPAFLGVQHAQHAGELDTVVSVRLERRVKQVERLAAEAQPQHVGDDLVGPAQLVEHGRGHLVLIGPGWDDELVHSSVEGVLLTARRQGRISVLGTISDKKISIRFDANTNPKLPWKFKAAQTEMTVKLGEQTFAFYEAQNLDRKDVTGTAVFNVTPLKAGPYFSKIECFCFTEQTLTAGQRVDMPVQFFVDPEIFTNPDTKDVNTVTLSYTFYPAEPEEKSVDATEHDNKQKKS